MQVSQMNDLSQNDRTKLAGMIVKMFDHWELSILDQLALLGLSSRSRSVLARYRKGKPLSSNRDLIDRVGNLLGIHKSLRLLFPKNQELAYRWMNQPNKAFGGQTPTNIIKSNGFTGLLMVRTYLDRIRKQ